MVVDIVASALKASEAGEYLVIVSAFPAEPGGGIGTFPNRAAKANTADEAKALAEGLAANLRGELERLGHQINRVSSRI